MRGQWLVLCALVVVPAERSWGLRLVPRRGALQHPRCRVAALTWAGAQQGGGDEPLYHLEEVPVHSSLDQVVAKHWACQGKWLEHHAVSRHTEAAFAAARTFVCDFHRARGRTRGPLPVILDSGCGTGASTLHIARLHPDLPVIGVDRSVARLSKNAVFKSKREREDANDLRRAHTAPRAAARDHPQPQPPLQAQHEEDQRQPAPELAPARRPTGAVSSATAGNALLLRADMVDFWLLASECCRGDHDLGWQVEQHFVLYPNPCPKPKQLKTRWHGHSVFPTMMQLHAGRVVLRASWQTYANEFACAVRVLAASVDAAESAEAEALARTLQRYSHAAEAGPAAYEPPEHEPSWTNFEAKYRQAGQPLFELVLG